MNEVEGRKRRPTIIMRNARLLFRNFSGKAGTYNAEGERNFCVLLDVEFAKQLEQDGWNIRWPKPSADPDDTRLPFTQIRVSYRKIPPRILLQTGGNTTPLPESEIHILDYAEFDRVDLVVNPSTWHVNNKTGIKGYLKSMRVRIAEDDLEMSYEDVPDSALSSLEDEE